MLEIQYNLSDIEAIAEQIIKLSTSKTLLFVGEMGVGKTTLIKQLVKSLGCNDTVSSPTYSLVNEYRSDTDCIYHFDLYRIEHEEDLYDFGIEDYLYSDAWKLVEWPQLLMNSLEDDYQTISIVTNTDQTRTLKLV